MPNRLVLSLLGMAAGSILIGTPMASGFAQKSSDTLLMRDAFKAAELSRWKTFRIYTNKVNGLLAKKLMRWRRLIDSPNGTHFSELNAFLRANPKWPKRGRILRHAERLMPFTLAADETIAWFGTRGPYSAGGRMRLGSALIIKGKEVEARKIIRDAWITGNFTRADSKAVYKKFFRYLSTEDHIARMDRLLWDGKIGAARRMLYIVPENWRKLAQARYSLRNRRGNVDYLISKVPSDLRRHLGLVYERVRWRRRKGKDSVWELLDDLPDTLPRPELWWREKARLARQALRNGLISKAYKLAKSHGLSAGGANYADAEFLAGWIALRFLKEPGNALIHFESLFTAVNYPVSMARAAYWAGRAADALKNKDKAVAWFGQAALHPFTYYGQLAFSRLYPAQSLPVLKPRFTNIKNLDAFKKHELTGVIKILQEVGEPRLMRLFFEELFEVSGEASWQYLSAKFALSIGQPGIAISLAKRANRQGNSLLDVGYPVLAPPKLPKKASNLAPEISLTLAVIRQESAFQVDAKSHASARGLMQIMPATAKRVAKSLDVQFSRDKLITDPSYNMALGQAYLGGLISDFQGSYVLALAGYNAGPHRARRWLKAHGDPRSDDVDAIDWVEMIPFYETRNYVQRVLENLQVYRQITSNGDVVPGLTEDLHLSNK
ncbi:MAG: hypothetical protein CBB68_04565 [Rhodospirillaceae bacterium TMED8]|nr:murein transglycosylase [Magnetovibrio sp.]OUT51607.1 MAG: hypothetical protein CBB68_04565 [Rhodospirillaceae bacterium TMED8]